jgi:competence protein ComEA
MRARVAKKVPKAAGSIDIDTTSVAERESLPVIGPTIARRIIEGRPYRSMDDLERVKGIGRNRLEEFRPLVTAKRDEAPDAEDEAWRSRNP